MFYNARFAIQPLAETFVELALNEAFALSWQTSQMDSVGDSLNPTACELSPPLVVFFFHQSPEQRVD